MHRIGPILHSRLCRAAAGVLVVILPSLLSSYPVASAGETAVPVGVPIAIENSQFAHSDSSKASLPGWTFEERRAELAHASAERQRETHTTMAIPEDGEGVLLNADGDLARGDLVSAPIKVEPFHWARVTLEYVVESGAPALFVCLRPTSDPSLVDLAFLPKASPGEKRSGTVELHTGIFDGDYSLSVSILGEGAVRVLSIEAGALGEYQRPQKPVFVVDLLHSRPVEKLGWKNAEKLVKVFGFPSIEFQHCTEVTREKLDEIDPGLIILSPISSDRIDPQSTDMDRVQQSVREAIRFGAPVVGICAGHQTLAWLNPYAEHGTGREWGPTRIEIVEDDPVFEGLPRSPYFYASESHNYIVKDAGRGRAEIIASTDICKTQVYRYKGRSWYTFQAHIERGWEDSCPEVYLLWKNMLRTWELIP